MPRVAIPYSARLEAKITEQFGSQRVGYLLGAGASYLNGSGYPLAGKLWECICDNVRQPERDEIQGRLNGGADGIEHALDLLDDGSATEKQHRYLVTEAIADHFHSINPPIDLHQIFVRKLAAKGELSIPIFCLNYDGLLELAADAEMLRIVDGFAGHERLFFDPTTYQEHRALTYRGLRKPQADWRKGTLHLYKLHGSLGWINLGGTNIRRVGLSSKTPVGAKRLMVPPQHRKAIDTTAFPYSALWSDFRSLLCHGPAKINRLVCIGYGLRDEHLNAVIENALGRSDFTMLAFAHGLADDVFLRWSAKRNVIIVTEKRCSLYKESGPGHASWWDFAALTQII